MLYKTVQYKTVQYKTVTGCGRAAYHPDPMEGNGAAHPFSAARLLDCRIEFAVF